jgi:phenylpyruvate tautomerase PptA (4-oxalocrotonate tautomerase family)
MRKIEAFQGQGEEIVRDVTHVVMDDGIAVPVEEVSEEEWNANGFEINPATGELSLLQKH